MYIMSISSDLWALKNLFHFVVSNAMKDDINDNYVFYYHY